MMTVAENAFVCLPSELTARPQWCVWRREDRLDPKTGELKPTKVLKNPKTGGNAQSTNPSTWTTYGVAVEALDTGKYEGLGFVFSPEDPYAGVDLDHCRNAETGEIAVWAREDIALLASYAEESPSGTGVHVIVRATLPVRGKTQSGRDSTGRKKGQHEAYDRDRFFTMTGKHIEGTPATVEERQVQFDQWCAKVFADKAKPPKKPTQVVALGQPRPDDVVMATARAAANGAKFADLFAGRWEGYGYPSQSEADMALVGILYYWTQDAEQIDRIFRASRMYRPEQWGRLGMHTITKVIERGGEIYAWPQPWDPILNAVFSDLGNAERLRHLYGTRIRYCLPMARWFVWNGKVWKPDPGALMRGLAAQTARKTLRAAAMVSDATQQKELIRHAVASEKASAGRACVSQAETLDDLHIDTDDLDADPMVLNTPSGLVDLRTGTLRAHDPAALCTKITRVPLDPNADCPVWLAFLKRIFDGNQAVMDFVQRLSGYSLTGLITEQNFIILWGAGANGKSTLVELLVWLLGDYGVTVDMAVWMAGRDAASGAATPERIPLRGARLSASVESAQGRRLNAAFIKHVTGGDRISARGLYEGQITFPPTFKPWMSTNHKPRIQDDSDGMWRRVVLLPFNVQIPGTEQDKSLTEKLRAEAPGILAWAVDGCLAWQQDGLNPPDEVRAAVQEYREGEDMIAAFLADCCTVAPNASVPAGALFKAWRDWATANEEAPGNSTTFGTALTRKGFERDIGTGGKRLRRGLCLRAEAEVRLESL